MNTAACACRSRFRFPWRRCSRESINFLPAGKSLGVTHLTNGAFRLHPVEWNIGESSGVIASLWLEGGGQPKPAAVQQELARRGVQMVWFDDLPSHHPEFAVIQLAALRGIYPLGPDGLHASPGSTRHPRGSRRRHRCVLRSSPIADRRLLLLF